ncbi:MAG: cell wall hydrolase [Lachnospiraceae bacterium]|nr:cell wall hydrolase [Lachnospiraceae bacterium]
MKKNKVKLFPILLAVILITAAMPYKQVFATSAEERLAEAEREMEKLKNEKAAIDKERNSAKEDLAGLNYQQSSLRQQLEELNTELMDTAEELEKLEKDIAAKEEEVIFTEAELAYHKELEEEQYDAMQNRIQHMYENGDNLYLEMLFGADSFAEFINMTEYLNMLSKYDTNLLEEYTRQKEVTQEKEILVKAEQKELEVLKQQALNERARIDGLIESTSLKMADYAAQIADAKDELSDIEKELAAKEDEMEEQQDDIDQIRREIELSKLSAESEKRDISEITFEEGDRYLLANLIYCEAGGEPYEGQVAVGAVVINRVLSSVFPDTVYNVIYQKKQFSPVGNGRLALALAQNKATESCYKAADAAMAGYSNVGYRVFFRTIIPGIEGIIIGRHIFY